jgi:hypothetical protein
MSIFSEELGRLILQNHIDRLFFFSWEHEEIVEWRP